MGSRQKQFLTSGLLLLPCVMEEVMGKIEKICDAFGSDWILLAVCVAVFVVSSACIFRTARVQANGTVTPCWVSCMFRMFPSCTPKMCCCCIPLDKFFFKCTADGEDKAHWVLKEEKVHGHARTCLKCLIKNCEVHGVLGTNDLEKAAPLLR